jgi:hypothetical protein
MLWWRPLPDSDAVLRGSRLGFRQPLQRAVFAMLDGCEGGPADNRVTTRDPRTGLVACRDAPDEHMQQIL